MPAQTQIQTRRGTAASWTSTNPTLAAGEIGFETDTGKFKIGNGSTAWAALAYSAGATAVTYLFNATSGQTTFSGADANGLTLAYTVGAEQVYLNGVLQVRGSDYTATNGTSIVLASGALTSDVLNVIAYSAMTITDTYTQAQADAKFVQQSNNFFAGKNKFINADFGIWQRGTSSGPTVGFSGYLADRFLCGAVGDTVTYSQQTFTAGAAPVAGYESQYFARQVVAFAAGAGNYAQFQQRIEDVRNFAGQTVTISYWAKADAAKSVSWELQQNFGSGGSANVNTFIVKQALTTSWARYSATFTVPSVSGKTMGAGNCLDFRVWLSAGSTFDARTSSLGQQNITFDSWGWQIEAGSIATPFQTATGTIQGELAACQRYYYLHASGINLSIGNAGYYSASQVNGMVQFPVVMRTAPSLSATSGTDYYVAERNGGADTFNSLTIYRPSTTTAMLYNGSEASGTAGHAALLYTNNASSSVAFSAEL